MADGLAVPRGPGEITPGWLTDALRAGGALPHGAVRAVSVETIGADRGFTGVVARLTPAYQDVAAGRPPPASIVAKLPTADREVASAYRTNHGTRVDQHYQRCAREVAFYRDAAAGQVRTPRLHYAATDPDRGRIVLLLEDLSGWRGGDNLAGCTAPEAAAILEAIAPLHARMWERHTLDWVPVRVTDYDANQQRYATRVAPFLGRYGERLPPPVRALVERLRTSYGGVLAELYGGPATLVHGDLHLDNVLFGLPGADRPVAILDWQGVCWAPAAVDVAAVLFGSLATADRRASERELLRQYLERLGVDGYPLDRLLADCRRALLCQVAGRVGWLATAEPDQVSDRERALLDAAFGDRRLVAALQDHDLV